MGDVYSLDELMTRERETRSQSRSDLDASTQDALALAFADQHIDGLRYTAPWNRWHLWDGARWVADDRLRHFDLARQICREAAVSATTPRIRRELAKAATVAAVVQLARADQRLAAGIEEWDADPWLLNTPGGTVDLRTGDLRPHRREDHMTKITAVAPAPPGSSAPLWEGFLAEVLAYDWEMVRYLQRVIGYSLTGSTREHALFFLFGTGANGKGTFLNTCSAIHADYARTAPMEVFTESHTDRHPTELAMLRGARLVAAQETEEGRRWAESRIKALTGGDPISARFMRQDFFEFTPQFKLVIAGNHKPVLRNVDEAMRRRLHLVPFTVTIPAARRDPNLPERLKAEWPAILRWMIDGCLEWQRQGLQPPPAVRSATGEYFEDQDQFATWLDECATPDEFAHETTRELFANWRKWCDGAGLSAGSEPKFRERLKQRGFTPKREPGTGRAGFEGIRLRRHNYTDDGRYGG